MAYTLRQLAECSGAELIGDADCEVHGISSLSSARSGEISFLTSTRYVADLEKTSASAVILTKPHVDACPTHALVVSDPHLAYARIARLFYPLSPPRHAVATSARLDKDCTLDAPVSVAHGVCIGPDVHIAAGCCIAANCVIAPGARLGPDCRLGVGVSVGAGVRLGARVIVQSGTVIGSDGFGMAWTGKDWLKIPQAGTVVVGDDVEIGANTTVDRGALDDTVLENGVKIDNLVHIAHNVCIGEHTAIAACVAIAGSTHVGRRCRIGGAVAISDHLQIADDVVIMGMSGVAKSIRKPGMYASSLPLMEARVWRRSVLRLPQLDAMAKALQQRS